MVSTCVFTDIVLLDVMVSGFAKYHVDEVVIDHMLTICRSKQNLKVREHNILGPYVDGLSMCVVSSFEVSCFSLKRKYL